MRRLVVLGPPSSDRMTVAELIAGRLGVPVFSLTTVAQAEFRAQTPASVEFKRFMDAGDLVPDELLLSTLLTHLDVNGFVLDGFPHSASQAAMLAASGPPVDRVVDLVLSDEEITRRLTGRRMCRGCGRGWHVEFDPPPESGRCGWCGGELLQRDDDSPRMVAARLPIYRDRIAPVLEYYRQRGLMVDVDATLPLEQIAEAATC
ncbi:adenylate kinase family protein [Dactylosporangium siamense]|uniref:Adenylate kinase n=1 Tax=Dactylosporangium siamense TaxID=685454 RepID=A0A919PCM5_9ACTN|nr:nucleoside monophosphate kinase [Dactylosporangium siamense]GIG42315.1 adenylate kinase [Dactylosporangium siamense]